MDVNGLINISNRYCNKIFGGEITTEGEDDGFIHLSPMYGHTSKNDSIASADYLGANSIVNNDRHIGLDNIENNSSLNEVQYLDVNTSPKEIISYQRFGKIDKKNFSNLNFKCHLCGFSCAVRETLLKHFDEEHPI